MGAAFSSVRFFAALIISATAIGPFQSTQTPLFADTSSQKLDPVLRDRASKPGGRSRVIVRTAGTPAVLSSVVQQAGGSMGRHLAGISSHVAFVPNGQLKRLAASPLVDHISLDRDIVGTMDRTAATVGAAAVRQDLGFDGSGVGVAIIDSGITSWHDDLSNSGGGQRVARFVDFVNGGETPYDDFGHGTHVAGIIAGNGYDSSGARTGIAPGADLIVLKVLDAQGRGHVSDVISAIDYAIDHRGELNVDIINISVASGVYESYTTDPLTLAARRAVEAGMLVVASAGNGGRNLDGRTQYGGITSPGNYPWVLTVGASSHMGTVDRGDDTIAAFSSRGPSAIDFRPKPDIVAPGVGIESLADPASALYSSASAYLLSGTVDTSYLPYLSLSGTSMSAPVVSGAAALMLQANPGLTPNQLKAILQFTSELRPSYDPLTEGAGFLNAKGAVELAQYLSDPSNVAYPDDSTWGKRIIWANRLTTGGRFTNDANAWPANVRWGALTVNGKATYFGVLCGSGSDCTQTDGNGKWRIDRGAWRNVVWGAACAGADCTTTWSLDAVAPTVDGGETVVWGTDGGETVVWGTVSGETVVWGTGDGETVVWGTINGETVVWGTSCTDPSCTPVIWSRK